MTIEKSSICGFWNHIETEALEGALPTSQNSPQKVPFNLYAEQLNGSAFTVPRRENLRSWLYRVRPSVVHGAFETYQKTPVVSLCSRPSPNQIRYSPIEESRGDFIDGLFAIAGSKAANSYIYRIHQSNQSRFFYNADGVFLFVPEYGDNSLIK